jgi:hypothetical protein
MSILNAERGALVFRQARYCCQALCNAVAMSITDDRWRESKPVFGNAISC